MVVPSLLAEWNGTRLALTPFGSGPDTCIGESNSLHRKYTEQVETSDLSWTDLQ